MHFPLFSAFWFPVLVHGEVPVIGRPGSRNGRVQSFPTTDSDRGYWVLAMHWPKTTCEIINENEGEDCQCELGDSRLNDFNSWKIHGYWPADTVGTGCLGQRNIIQSNETTGIDTQLLHHWPNLRNREKRGLKCDAFGPNWLWEQSWCQHGAVKPNRFPSPLSYFQQALEVAKRWRLSELFASEQIKPHDKNTYTLKQLNEALMKKAGALGAEKMGTKFFSLHCGCEKNRRRESQKLWEVRICLDRSNTPVHFSRCGLDDCCDGHNAIFYPPRQSGSSRNRRAQLFDKDQCAMNACSYKQISSIPGMISPAVARRKKEVKISAETNPGLVVGVSLALVIGASVIAALVYVRLNRSDPKLTKNGRRSSGGSNDIMHRLYMQTGLMQFSQPEPGYVHHVLKGESNYPPHRLPTPPTNYPEHQIPALPTNYPQHDLPQYPAAAVDSNYPTHEIRAPANYSMHQLPTRRASYSEHHIPHSNYSQHAPLQSNYPLHALPQSRASPGY